MILERSIASLYYINHPRHHQNGVAVLLAVLTVALVAGIATSILSDYGAAVDKISGRHDVAQAQLISHGAIDWARNVLSEDFRTSNIDYSGEIWATRIPPLPIEEGEVSGEIDDLSGRFDVNRLVRQDGTVDLKMLASYKRLLVYAGIRDSQAISLANALADWLDADSEVIGYGGAELATYQTLDPPIAPANTFLVDIGEIRQVTGYSPDILEKILPFLIAFPSPAAINVNTASAEVLAATIPDLTISNARIVVGQQLTAPYKDINDFLARLPNKNIVVNNELFAATSRYFLATGRAHFGEATKRLTVLLDRSKKWPNIIWKKAL